MTGVDIAAVLVAIAAASGYINHHLLKLPATSGTLVVALASSLLLIAVDHLLPTVGLEVAVRSFIGAIDFNQTLLRGRLGFLLFAGALHLDLEGLLEHKFTIGAFATVGVAVSTAVVSVLTWWAFRLVGVPAPFLCAWHSTPSFHRQTRSLSWVC
jgi:CPA1 family monovalent cation:H+ antiporter